MLAAPPPGAPAGPPPDPPGVTLASFSHGHREFSLRDDVLPHQQHPLFPLLAARPATHTTSGLLDRPPFLSLSHENTTLPMCRPLSTPLALNGDTLPPGLAGQLGDIRPFAPPQAVKLEPPDDLWDVYSHKPTSELLSIYERQQEELVQLSKQLEDYTRKNIELSTSNLEQLRSLQNTNTPIVSNVFMQPPQLSQVSLRVRQQSRRGSVSAIVPGGSPLAGGSPQGLGGQGEAGQVLGVTRGTSGGAGGVEGAEGEGEAALESAPQGICTQEDAAAILMQMSRRMADDQW